DCASGHVDSAGTVPCDNITIVGACEDLCAPLDPAGGFYPSCDDPAFGPTTDLITTALPPAPTPDAKGDLTVETSAPVSMAKGPCAQLVQTITVTNAGSIVAPSPVVTHALSDGLV